MARPFTTALVICCLLAGPAIAQDIPAPVGHVNDFADILPDTLERGLETELRAFKDRTHHEIAVVTVTSLDGESIEDFTIRLAQQWGVGGADANDGVVLLYAKKEGEVRIEVGYGLESVLNDARAGDIIRKVMVPEKARNGLPAAILAGARAVEARIESPATAAPTQPAKPMTRTEQIALFAFFGLIAVVVFSAWIISVIRHRRAITKFRKECKRRLDGLPEKIEHARATFHAIVKRHPAINLQAYYSGVDLGAIKRELDRVEGRPAWEREEILATVHRLLGAAEQTLAAVDELEAKIVEAQEQTPALASDISESRERIVSESSHDDVSPETKERLRAALAEHDDLLEKLTQPSGHIDWLAARKKLAEVNTAFTEIENAAKTERVFAERARKEGPELLKRLRERRGGDRSIGSDASTKLDRAEKHVAEGLDWPVVFALLLEAERSIHRHDYSAHRTTRSTDSTRDSSNQPSRSFGGFGGGSFGGGGASGKL